MQIEILFKDNDGEVFLRGGSKTGDILRAEMELESMAQKWHKMIESGEICVHCENEGYIEVGEFDDINKVQCSCQKQEDESLSE